MKITKKVLKQYIKEVLKESRYGGKYYRRRNVNPMNQQSDSYVDSDYKAPPARTYDSWVEKEKPLAGAYFHWKAMPLLIEKSIEIAPTVKSESEMQPAVEFIAAEIAKGISTPNYQVNKDTFLKSKERHIRRMLEAAIKDYQGIPVEQYKR